MAYFSFGKAMLFQDDYGNNLPSGDYCYGPWTSKEEAWKKLTFDDTGATTHAPWIARGQKFGVFTDDGVTEYRFNKVVEASVGYTIDDAEEIEAGGVTDYNDLENKPFIYDSAKDCVLSLGGLAATGASSSIALGNGLVGGAKGFAFGSSLPVGSQGLYGTFNIATNSITVNSEKSDFTVGRICTLYNTTTKHWETADLNEITESGGEYTYTFDDNFSLTEDTYVSIYLYDELQQTAAGDNAFAMGQGASAYNPTAFAFGYKVQAYAYATAWGNTCYAYRDYSRALGLKCTANAKYSIALGLEAETMGSNDYPEYSEGAIAICGIASGRSTIAFNTGKWTTVSGTYDASSKEFTPDSWTDYLMIKGNTVKANGIFTTIKSCSKGTDYAYFYLTEDVGATTSLQILNGGASGSGANALGGQAIGQSAKAFGGYALADSAVAFPANYVGGQYSLGVGMANYTPGQYALTSGASCFNMSGYGQTMGYYCYIVDRNMFNSSGAHCEGYFGAAQGYGAHCEGRHVHMQYSITAVSSTTATNNVVLTLNTELFDDYDYVVGKYCCIKVNGGHKLVYLNSIDSSDRTKITVTGYGFVNSMGIQESYANTFAVGETITIFPYGALNTGAHAEGRQTLASGECSHSEGASTYAVASYSHAEGTGTIASGYGSHTEGSSTHATNDYEHAQGKLNVSSKDTTTTAYKINCEIGGRSYNIYCPVIGIMMISSTVYQILDASERQANGYFIINTSVGKGAYVLCYDYLFGNMTTSPSFYDATTKALIGDVTALTYDISGFTSATGTYISTASSHGMGKNTDARNNAYELRSNGRLYLRGLGGYDGISVDPTTTKDLLTYIQYLEQRIAKLENP